MKNDRFAAKTLSLFVYTSEKRPRGLLKDGHPEGNVCKRREEDIS